MMLLTALPFLMFSGVFGHRLINKAAFQHNERQIQQNKWHFERNKPDFLHFRRVFSIMSAYIGAGVLTCMRVALRTHVASARDPPEFANPLRPGQNCLDADFAYGESGGPVPKPPQNPAKIPIVDLTLHSGNRRPGNFYSASAWPGFRCRACTYALKSKPSLRSVYLYGTSVPPFTPFNCTVNPFS